MAHRRRSQRPQTRIGVPIVLGVVAIVTAGVVAWAVASGSDDDQPAADGTAHVIDVHEAQGLVEAGTGVLVDTRSAQSHAAGHAAGAVLAPLGEIAADPNLPPITTIPAEQAMILYCT